ncbi:MAG: hypothetical protein OXF33_09065 [Rhodospirillales bacterium]|nr:hypothetical protein [Rhodospirillales bacterium]
MTGNEAANLRAVAIEELSELRRHGAYLETKRARFVAQLSIAAAMLDPDRPRIRKPTVTLLNDDYPTRDAIDVLLEDLAETAQEIEKLEGRLRERGTTA